MSDVFTIHDVDFKRHDYGLNSAYLKNWPMLYILENGSKAYVGQTTNIIKRMSQHKANENKALFNKAHFIYYEKFNQSATFDYESRLIGLMAADSRFVLTNRNVGLTNLDYYQKQQYDEDFKTLWRKLQDIDLAHNTIEELQQSDLFKYSPYKELNSEQRNLVTEIIEGLKRNLERKIVINGMPGSGKTIVAIYLFKLLREIPDFKNKKIGLVVPPTSLRDTLKKVFKSVDGLSSKDVIGPSEVAGEFYDIILVDEAHRLKCRKNLSSYASYDKTCKQLGLDNSVSQLDWILKQSKCAIFFFDQYQIVFPAGLQIKEMINNDPFDRRMVAEYTLYSQMRCQGGAQYLDDLLQLFSCNLNHRIKDNNGYELKLVDSFEEFEKQFRAKEKEHGLTRMIAGYAWPWKSKNDVKDHTDNYDIVIEGYQKKWNSTLKNWVHSDNAVNEVGCIHSTQGYDLNYGFVILGEDICYNSKDNRIYSDASHYYDKYGKIGASNVELDKYIKNIYYVLMTRGIKGTYLYVCDPELKKYLRKYIDVFKGNEHVKAKHPSISYGIDVSDDMYVAEDSNNVEYHQNESE